MRTIRNCNVAVVGGAGFLGSHLVNYLIDDRNCRVLVVDNLVAGRREWVHPKADFEHADITESEDHLSKLFAKYGVRHVFNYAAWPYIVDSFSRPLHVFNVNATGAIKVINAAQSAGCEAILQVSSAELYGGPSQEDVEMLMRHGKHYVGGRTLDHPIKAKRIDESFPIEPHSTYGAAKAAVDYYCQTAWRERKTPVIALRQFNCVGPRDILHPYVIPEIYKQLRQQKTTLSNVGLGGKAKVKLGNNSYRDFLDAEDAVKMAVELLEYGQPGEVYNSGSETGIKIYDLARLIGKIMGFSDVEIERDESRVRPWEIWHLAADCSKLYSVIKYRPRFTLEESLRKTIAYFDETADHWLW